MKVTHRRQTRVTVSGSFHRHIGAIQRVVEEFNSAGVVVLSPSDPRVVDEFGEFLFVASDLRRSVRGVQNRHLAAVSSSDLLWLECPDGYVGPSAAFEIGYAMSEGVPVYASTPPGDLTMRQYVRIVKDPRAAIREVAEVNSARPSRTMTALLLDPVAAVQSAHEQLEQLQLELTSPLRSESDPAEHRIESIERTLALPVRST